MAEIGQIMTVPVRLITRRAQAQKKKKKKTQLLKQKQHQKKKEDGATPHLTQRDKDNLGCLITDALLLLEKFWKLE